jgi:hypothetical protein
MESCHSADGAADAFQQHQQYVPLGLLDRMQ